MIFFNRNLYRNYLKADTQGMVRNVFVLLILFFLFNCGGNPDIREDPTRTRRGPPDQAEDELSVSGRRGTLKACEGTDYVIYTHGDCQDFKDIQPSPVDSIATHQVDILFILDHSKSMDSFLKKENMCKKFESFLSDIRALDWRMIFTNTNYGKFRRNGSALGLQNVKEVMDRKYLDSTVSNYENVFFDTISKEEGDKCDLPPGCTNGVLREQPLKVLRSSFSRNQIFTRSKADFIVVIVTNVDEGKMKDDTAEELVGSVLT